MRTAMTLIVAVCFVGGPHMDLVGAQPDQAVVTEEGNGPKRDKATHHRWQVGVVIRAGRGNCQNIFATVPVPVDWPDQEVKLDKEELSPLIRSVRYRTIDGGVKQMVLSLKRLPANGVVDVKVTFDLVRYSMTGPENPIETLFAPKKRIRQLIRYLGESPFIETRNAKIREKAQELVVGKETAWEQVEEIYDFVRDDIELVDGKLKGAAAALKDNSGNTEDKSSLFIALCRASRVPARTVWVEGHNYAEFYLVDAKGDGYWFPCQIVGARDFGSINDHRPILQKGDNAKPPEQRRAVRYVPEHVRIKCRGGKPQVRFIRKLLPTED